MCHKSLQIKYIILFLGKYGYSYFINDFTYRATNIDDYKLIKITAPKFESVQIICNDNSKVRWIRLIIANSNQIV